MFQPGGILLALVDALLVLLVRRRLRGAFPRSPRAVDAVCAAAFVLLAHPALVMAARGWGGMRALQRHVPEVVSMTAMGAQVALILYGLLWGGAALATSAVRALGRLRGATAGAPIPAASSEEPGAPGDEPRAPVEPRPPVAPDPGRRRVLAGAAWVLPAAATGVSFGGVVSSRQKPVVTRVLVPVRRDLTGLHGLTFAQISDVHVGNFMDAERLDEIRDAVNALGADFHVVTGDLLDNHVSQLELSTRLLRGLRPARGELFFCMGNHEHIAARSSTVATIVKGLEEAGAQVLVDEARRVRVGGDHLWMGGVDYPSRARPGETARRPTKEALERALGQMSDDGAPRILLSHHPRVFQQARELPIDLMLSGHTHGGQIYLGRVGDHAVTPMAPFEHYHNGLYVHGPRRLYVNAGAGGWLPVRINCPPEITLVELVPA